MARGLRCVVVMRELLDPRRYGFFSLQLLSHKLLMRTAVIPLALLAVSNALLWNQGLIYRLALIGQAVFYLLGTLGILLADRGFARWKPFALPAYFSLINAAAAKAIWQLLRGERHERWEPDRVGPRPRDHAA
jgi:intracellular septation protein A